MLKTIHIVFMLFLASTDYALAADLSGTWQGVMKYQHVLKLMKMPDRGYQGQWFNLGQEQEGTLNGNPISSVDFDGSHLKFTPGRKASYYDGTLSADGNTITGTWGGNTASSRRPLNLVRATASTAWVIDPSPHKAQFVTVDKNVKLEVLDWGGNGPPLVFLSGLGSTAHVFDTFAPRFAKSHHIYAITRRGFGASSAPSFSDEANYDADRLGDDVLAVLTALKIKRPILAGHSIAGEELSSIGTRYPDRVAGLIYLDAAYPYALYNPARGSFNDTAAIVRRELVQIGELPASETKAMLSNLLETQLPRLQDELADFRQRISSAPETAGPQSPPSEADHIESAIVFGSHEYLRMEAPALVLIALPHDVQRDVASPSGKVALDFAYAQAAAVEAGMPRAKIVKLPYANHFVFRSNEAEVEQEMNLFMDGLH